MRKNIKYLTILFLLLMLSSCGTLTTLNTDTPENILCTKDAKTMEENYIKYRSPKCDDDDLDSSGNCDNRVISFTYLQMKEYMEYLEAQRSDLDINEEDLGFRVYFGGKHSDEFQNDNIEKGHLKKITEQGQPVFTTIFFAPTIKKDDAGSDPGSYYNMYDIAPFNYGSSRRPPNAYDPGSEPCPILKTDSTHTHS